MTIFLRTPENDTIIEADARASDTPDFSVTIDVTEYSKLLLDRAHDPDVTSEAVQFFVEVFNHLHELRGAWWEGVREQRLYTRWEDFVLAEFGKVADLFGFQVVTD